MERLRLRCFFDEIIGEGEDWRDEEADEAEGEQEEEEEEEEGSRRSEDCR